MSELGRCPASKCLAVLKVPLPLPSSTLMLSLSRLATTRSCFAVAVEVRDAQRHRSSADREVHRGLEGAVAVAQQHADGVAPGVGHGQVELAVAVEVPHRHGARRGPGGEVDGAAAKVPLPLPSSTLTLSLPALATARSGLPSPLKSPTATEIGRVPGGEVDGGLRRCRRRCPAAR